MRKRGLRHYNMPVFLILLLVSVVMIFPFIWMVLSAFKTNADVYAYPIRWLPSSFEWSNFQKVFQMVPFLRYYWNTILTSVLQTAIQIAMSIGAAYAFAKLHFPFKRTLYMLIQSAMFVPMSVLVIPLYQMVSGTGLVDTYAGIVLPQVLGVFTTMMLISFFTTIPDDLIDAAKIDECAEVDDGRDDAFANLALLELREEGLANLGLGLLEVLTTGQNHIVAVLVELEHLGLDLLADVRREIAHAAHLDKGGRKEAAQADVDDQAALDGLDDGALDDAVVFLDLLDVAPGALVLGALLGQDETPFLVFLRDDKGFDGVADLDDIIRIDVLLDGKFAGRNYTFGLVADVQENLVVIDLDDGALYQITIVEVLDGGIDCLDEVVNGADVVDGDLFDFCFVFCH